MILVDTNVLARSIQANSLHQLPALNSLRYLGVEESETLVVSPQILTEFYAISTRGENGLRLSPQEAILEIEKIKTRFQLLEETSQIFPALEDLIAKHRPTNRRVFDVRHVASMIVHSVSTILTFNDKDFLAYTEVKVLNPFDVLRLPRV